MTSLRQIVADILVVRPEEIQDGSSPREFPQWDSAAHIEIVLAVEGEYGVRFTPGEMVEVMSVGALRDVLRRKGAPVE